MLSERQIINYAELELEIMRLKKEDILNDIKILNLANRCVIYPNQEAIDNEVVKSFKNRNITNTMVLAKTQSGKTSSMCATIRTYLENHEHILSNDN